MKILGDPDITKYLESISKSILRQFIHLIRETGSSVIIGTILIWSAVNWATIPVSS